MRQIDDLTQVETGEIEQESLAEGFHMVQRLVADFQSGANRFDREGELLLGVFAYDRLIALGCLNATSTASKARVRRVYVLPEFRRHGVASGIIRRLVDYASTRFSELELRTTTAEGAAFYEKIGFCRVSEEGVTHRLRLP